MKQKRDFRTNPRRDHEYHNKNDEYREAIWEMKKRHKEELNCLEMKRTKELLQIAIRNESSKKPNEIEWGWLEDCVKQLKKIELQERTNEKKK